MYYEHGDTPWRRRSGGRQEHHLRP